MRGLPVLSLVLSLLVAFFIQHPQQVLVSSHLQQKRSEEIKLTAAIKKPVSTRYKSKTKPDLVPTSNIQNFLINAVNEYRTTNGLASVQTDRFTCNFAAIRVREITSNFSHDGFNTRVNNNALPYPSYTLVVENLAQTNNYQEVIDMWINSPTHAANLRQNTPYACIAQNGDYYAYEGRRP